jgi:serine/threonine protein kinase
MKDFLKAVTEVGYNLAHDNILHLEEVVTGAGGNFGFIYPYMARTLEQVVQSGESLELEVVLGIISKIVDALAYSHQYKGLDGKIRRTFHHHLQPFHVLVSRDLKDCRLTSLGFSQVFRTVTNARQPRWQDPGMNPATMPPEFFLSRGGIIKERAAEVYSLGILIHLAVTGQYPFDGPGLSEYKHQHRTLPPTPLRLLNPQAPIWLEQIVLKCLEKEPEKRWDSVTEIQREIRRAT